MHRKNDAEEERQECTAEARRNAPAPVAQSEQAGKLTSGAAAVWEPVDLPRAAIAGKHDGFHPRESAETFGAVIAAVAAEAIAAKSGVRICNGADDVIDGAASRGELGGDAARTRAIVRPDAAAEGEGTRIGKRNGFELIAEGRHAERGPEGFFGKDAGLVGNVGE